MDDVAAFTDCTSPFVLSALINYQHGLPQTQVTQSVSPTKINSM